MMQDAASPRVVRMRRALAAPLPAPVWPAGARLESFGPADAAHVHALLALSYAQGGGTVPTFGAWWESLRQDTEFDPALLFLARDRSNRAIGVAQCWTSAFVKDLAVHPDWRRRGLGRALLLHAFSAFKARGAECVDLKVEAGNTAALALYRAVGMQPVAAGATPSAACR